MGYDMVARFWLLSSTILISCSIVLTIGLMGAVQHRAGIIPIHSVMIRFLWDQLKTGQILGNAHLRVSPRAEGLDVTRKAPIFPG